MKLKTSLSALSAVLLTLLASSCATPSVSGSVSGKPGAGSPAAIASLLLLTDGDYTLDGSMRLAATERLNFPSDPIPLSFYEPSPAGERPVFPLKFSEQGRKVQIDHDNKVHGSLDRSDAKSRVYRLSEGLFAGGRLIVEETPQGLVASFTEFGSGVPVISSYRGSLRAKTPN